MYNVNDIINRNDFYIIEMKQGKRDEKNKT